MFSGIIQGIGFLHNLKSSTTIIRTSLDLSDCKIGSSISCNGVCLTATSVEKLENNDCQTPDLQILGKVVSQRGFFLMQCLYQDNAQSSR